MSDANESSGLMDATLSRILGESVVWDNHACMPLRPGDARFLPELERVRAAGVNVVTLNVAFGNQTHRDALAMLHAFRDWVLQRPNEYLLVHNVGHVHAARATGRLGVCFDVEGMDALDHDARNVDALYALGVRWMLATYNRPNDAGGGCLADDAGLTAFGRAVVREMNRVGMVVCASHCGYRTARDLIDSSSAPVIFSHSNPRAVWDHPRNIPDSLMQACAARGGVIGINGFGPFLGANDTSVSTCLAHIEHALDVVGEDHVGIALDYVFDKGELDAFIAADPQTFPPDLYQRGARMIEPWRLPEIAEALSARGYSAETLRKVFGLNYLRIAHDVWR